MWPCKPPAKKARMDLCDGGAPPRRPVSLPVLRLISGNDASFRGLKPSEVLALHRTLIELLKRSGTYELE